MVESTNVFPREERLRKRKEFLRVYARGTKVRTRLFFIYLLENDLPYSRMGVTASRKVGKTNIRNRLKRRLREIFRLNKRLIYPPSDLVINTSAHTVKASFVLLEEEFKKVFRKEEGEQGGCGN